VVTVKYGKRLSAAFEQPGGKALQRWLNQCDNATFSALTFRSGAAWREAMLADPASLGDERAPLEAFLLMHSDDSLHALMTDLGGHCAETLLEAFAHASASNRRTAFIMYTIKGRGLPLAGHRDNHGLFMTSAQIDTLRARLGLSAGAEEWAPFSQLADGEAARRLLEAAPINQPPSRDHGLAERIAIPEDLAPALSAAAQPPTSTQAAFGAVLKALAHSDCELADRLVSACPDVTTTTGLSSFVNKRGVFAAGAKARDPFKSAKAHSLSNWSTSAIGQHVELGISENNLLLLLAAFGLSATLFGHRLFPIGAVRGIGLVALRQAGLVPRAPLTAVRAARARFRAGTLYDPFIARALDSLTYACYNDARFMLVGTPSGITLAPEGGAHQSFSTPLVGLSMPNLVTYEPAFADEVSALMRHGFDRMQRERSEGGGSVYLRLSTRVLAQPDRRLLADAQLHSDVLAGAYWHAEPTDTTHCLVVFAGAVAPEAAEAAARAGAALLQVTSYDALAAGWRERGDESYVARLLARVPRAAKIVTVLDGHPVTLAWLGAVHGHRTRSLGVSDFGQSGDLPDLYALHGIDADSIVRACAEV
jgi:pyruvate dehydrogenase E1 component